MPIQLSPETELLIKREIASGRFHSADEIIHKGIGTSRDIVELEDREKHRIAMERTRQFISDPIRLEGVTLQEIVDEGRRL